VNPAAANLDGHALAARYEVLRHDRVDPGLATELGKKFNLPLRYDAKVDQEAKAEAAKFFAADLQK
jgi:hypothetical protein